MNKFFKFLYNTYHKALCFIPKNQSHKQHIWFFADTTAKAKKPKELFSPSHTVKCILLFNT
jgi:hypothetical protein